MKLVDVLSIFRPVSPSDQMYRTIVEECGTQEYVGTSPAADAALVDAAVTLFRFIPTEPSDPRWTLAYEYLRLLNETKKGQLPFQFNNALLATYLSKDESYRNGFPTSYTVENVRQYYRAMTNLRVASNWEVQFSTGNLVEERELAIRFYRTASVSGGPDRYGITPCPEAVSQFQAWEKGRYIGRVGFNFHKERRLGVISIANIQGVPGYEYRGFEDKYGTPIFNKLVGLTAQLTCPVSTVELRGLKNPKRGDASLYNSVLKEEGIKRMSFHGKGN